MAVAKITPAPVPEDHIITIKFGEKFDCPWIVAHGSASEQAAYLKAAFGLEDSEGSATLAELVVECSRNAQQAWKASAGSGPRTLAKSTPAAPQAVSEAPAPAGSAWEGLGDQAVDAKLAEVGLERVPDEVLADEAAAEEPADAHAGLKAQAQRVTTKAELKLLWAKNQEAYNADKSVQEVFTTKAGTLAA